MGFGLALARFHLSQNFRDHEVRHEPQQRIEAFQTVARTFHASGGQPPPGLLREIRADNLNVPVRETPTPGVIAARLNQPPLFRRPKRAFGARHLPGRSTDSVVVLHGSSVVRGQTVAP
jgi:hypothetical protein